MSVKEQIAKRAAQEVRSGDIVNLGIGLPTLVADFIPPGIEITLQSENGILGMSAAPKTEQESHPDIVNAGGSRVTITPDACFFDSVASFSIMRGGHVDITVLGALQVDETGSLASHMIPGEMVVGMGGAMDLIAGAKRVIVATTHTTKDGAPKIVKRLSLPPTAIHRVELIVTELAVFRVTEQGLVLLEHHPYVTPEEIRALTEADFQLAEDLRPMAQ